MFSRKKKLNRSAHRAWYREERPDVGSRKRHYRKMEPSFKVVPRTVMYILVPCDGDLCTVYCSGRVSLLFFRLNSLPGCFLTWNPVKILTISWNVILIENVKQTGLKVTTYLRPNRINIHLFKFSGNIEQEHYFQLPQHSIINNSTTSHIYYN